MKVLRTHIAAAIVALASAVPATVASAYAIESSEDLGFGLRRVMVAEGCDRPGCFEALTHHVYLFYRDRKLGPYSTFSVAPGGQLILYQDGRSSEMMLFRPADDKLVRLTRNLRDVADQYEWSDNLRQVRIFFLNAKQWKTVTIPRTI